MLAMLMYKLIKTAVPEAISGTVRVLKDDRLMECAALMTCGNVASRWDLALTVMR